MQSWPVMVRMGIIIISQDYQLLLILRVSYVFLDQKQGNSRYIQQVPQLKLLIPFSKVLGQSFNLILAYLPLQKYNNSMKLFITVLLSLLLLQSATGLHLHAEEEGSGNFTTTSEASNITANETATIDVDATYSDMTEENDQISKALKDFDEIQISGDEELITAAKEAIDAFKAASEENTEKVLAASILSEEATDQERQEALEKVQKIKNEFKEALNNLTTKLQELKSKLQERLANTGSE